MLSDTFHQYKKQIVMVFSLFIVILVVLAGYNIYVLQTRKGKVAITVRMIPSDATILLDSTQTIKPGDVYMSPGVHSIKASKKGFENFTYELKVADRSNPILNIQLLASSDEAKKWVADHQTLYLEAEKNGGEQAQIQGEQFQEKNPITTKLPYNDPYYSIGYKSPDANTVELTVAAVSALYRYNAVQKIREWGYDPTDFKMLYTNYVSPLQ